MLKSYVFYGEWYDERREDGWVDWTEEGEMRLEAGEYRVVDGVLWKIGNDYVGFGRFAG